MTDKVRNLALEILEKIQKAQKILLTFHRGPDGDSMGSNLALAQLLKKMGKDVTLIKGDSVMPLSLKAFPGHEMVTMKNIQEIDLGQFDLFLILDCSTLTQATRLTNIVIPESLTVVVIDHHEESSISSKIILNDTSYPAVGQMLFDLLTLWKQPITVEVATCLFLAIFSDSQFKYRGTTSETFQVAGELTKICPEFPKAVFTFENYETPAQIAFIALALSLTIYPFEGKVALSAVRFEKIATLATLPDIVSTATISEKLREVAGVKISVSIAEKKKNVITVSFRSFDYDVSKISLALNGGGHAGAGGTLLEMSFDEANKIILESLQKIYPELNQTNPD